MLNAQKLKTKEKEAYLPDARQLLGVVLQEIRCLRQEIEFVLPQEDLKEYAHSTRIKRSYQKALKQYPPDIICE